MSLRGLSDAEAQRRLSRFGPNRSEPARRSVVGRTAAGVFKEPLFLLLFAAAAVYVALGDRAEALALTASAAGAAVIGGVQRFRTERALDALRRLASPRARVLRDGVARRIPAGDVVVGDLLLLEQGDRIPADARVVDADALDVDESLLTGEAVPVHKFTFASGHVDTSSSLAAQTLVTAGRAHARVVAVGSRTAFAAIRRSMEGVSPAPSPLQRDIARLARLFGAIGLALALVVVVGHGLLLGEWLDGLLRGLTLAMAILPEEFPLVMTVVLALGAWRLAGKHVLARRMEAIEALGAATVLAVDKTGTLTENRLRLQRVLAGAADEAELTLPLRDADGGVPPTMGIDPAADVVGGARGLGLARLAHATALASDPRPYDPIEVAATAWAGTAPIAPAPLRRYPLSAACLVMACAWPRADGRIVLAAKGAPEHVLRVCWPAGGPEAEAWSRATARFTAEGLRVLGVASAQADAVPASLDQAAWTFVGLLGFEDPLRPEVPAAMQACHAAGLRVLMITGDHANTAAAIARQAGLAPDPQVIDGASVERMSDAELQRRLPGVDVVARATPLAKLRLVQRLAADGAVVAMTGDGVNDAPALRAAHIGVAMGERGSDVAREAAGLVLLHDDFQSLVAGIAEGRRIFANLRQALLYVIAVHVPLIAVGLLPLLGGGPPLLLPLHVMFMEFVIDPACSIVFENEAGSPDAMRRPPRPATERVLGTPQVLQALVQGAAAASATLLTWLAARVLAADADATRCAVLSSLVAMNLALILHNLPGTRLRDRLHTRNKTLWWVAFAAVAAWALVVGTPTGRALFHLAVPSASLGLGALLAVAVGLALLGASGRVGRPRP